ncbi:MAG TPA: VTT domain-containing protein, partial [Leptospiraceae bacterium]|nr:VTT domain-containing protein [Leptospiraceae bacterium]
MLADGLAYVLIALSTFVSEDLTCIATGMAAATHKVALVPGIIACASGIFAGDLLLFAAGRILGRPAVKIRPLKWFVTERKIEESSRWFAAKGHWLILTSRFIPGTRLPTYFAAGLLKVNLVEFLFWFALAALL